MAHRIGRHEKVGKALRRLLIEDIAEARSCLSGDAPAEVRVHRARQRLKRARSLLRVLVPSIGPGAREQKRAVATAARLLAGARDADAAASSARGLRAIVTDGDGAGLDRVVAALDREAEEAHRRATPTQEVIARLAEIEAGIAAFARDTDGDALYERALVRSYARGRRALRRSSSSLATPDLHRWRKEVKDLWHLIRLARKRLPARAAGLADDLRRLGEALGVDHDHAILAEKLALSPDPERSLRRQLTLIAGERRRLEKEAIRLGRRIYAKKPRDFGEAMAPR